MTNPPPRKIKLEFSYDTSGALVFECNQQCGYRNTMMPEDFYPTDQVYWLRHTVDQIYHAMRHMRDHVQTGIKEGEIDAQHGSSVPTELSPSSARHAEPSEPPQN